MMDIINLISFIIGVVSLVLTVRYGDQSRKSYHLLMSNFEQKAIEALMINLKHGRLTGVQQVRGMVANTAIEYSIDPPSDEHIVRMLRRIALKYQLQIDDTEGLTDLLLQLESIRKELEPTGLPLASISSVNKMTAFLLIMGGLFITLFVYQTNNILTSGPRWAMLASVAGMLILLAAMMAISRRLKSISRHNHDGP